MREKAFTVQAGAGDDADLAALIADARAVLDELDAHNEPILPGSPLSSNERNKGLQPFTAVTIAACSMGSRVSVR